MGYGSWINVKIQTPFAKWLQNSGLLHRTVWILEDSIRENVACVAKFEQFYPHYVDVTCPGKFTFYQML